MLRNGQVFSQRAEIEWMPKFEFVPGVNLDLSPIYFLALNPLIESSLL